MKRRVHPLQQALQARLRLLATRLRPATVQQYHQTVRWFLAYLADTFPEVRFPSQLRRDPHLLGWLEQLWLRRVPSSGKPLCNHTRAAHLIRLWQTFLLLMRLTGMRIGETVDLAPDCLRHIWAARTGRCRCPSANCITNVGFPSMPRCALVARLRFLATLPPAASSTFLLPRPQGRHQLCTDLRAALRNAAEQEAGIAAPLVPHQLRHTYATTMLRAGISLPALMKLLGHRTANMTLRYVEITQQDLQRGFHLARQHPRHLVPLPASLSSPDPDTADASTVLQRLTAAIRLLDLFRQHHVSDLDKPLRLLWRRLMRIRSRFQKLFPGTISEK